MIHGIGVDIIHSERFEYLQAEPKDAFLQRCFTEKEREQALAAQDMAIYLAGRFAAKEAVWKALQLGDACRFSEIETLSMPDGRPEVQLLGDTALAAHAAGIDRVFISLSNDAGTVVAFVVCTRES